MTLKSVRDVDVKGKRVVVRVDFNAPLRGGVVVDDTRIKAALPTIDLLLKNGAAHVTLLTHVGRPEGRVVEDLRVAPIERHLKKLLSAENVTLEENVRFDKREEENDESYARELSKHGEIFVNDAFADSHREHASIVGIAKILPAYAGLLIEKEIENLEAALVPPKDSIAVIGGAKFETKAPLIEKLLKLYSRVLLGGALGNDVIKSRGLPIGMSLVSKIPVPSVLAMDERLIVPNDLWVQNKNTNASRAIVMSDTRKDEAIVDIGPNTADAWGKMIAGAPFVLWNGPMGMYEEGFTAGTDTLAKALAQSPAHGVVGGGDTIAAVSKTHFDSSRVFLSTGGGAMLEYLASGTLPGIEVLQV